MVAPGHVPHAQKISVVPYKILLNICDVMHSFKTMFHRTVDVFLISNLETAFHALSKGSFRSTYRVSKTVGDCGNAAVVGLSTIDTPPSQFNVDCLRLFRFGLDTTSKSPVSLSVPRNVSLVIEASEPVELKHGYEGIRT